MTLCVFYKTRANKVITMNRAIPTTKRGLQEATTAQSEFLIYFLVRI